MVMPDHQATKISTKHSFHLVARGFVKLAGDLQVENQTTRWAFAPTIHELTSNTRHSGRLQSSIHKHVRAQHGIVWKPNHHPMAPRTALALIVLLGFVSVRFTTCQSTGTPFYVPYHNHLRLQKTGYPPSSMVKTNRPPAIPPSGWMPTSGASTLSTRSTIILLCVILRMSIVTPTPSTTHRPTSATR